MSNEIGGEDTEPIVLKHAQRSIREAYFDHETGLFTLNCVPGSGKSVVAHHIAAEDILRRYVAGDPTPEQHVAVLSFNRDEAAEIIPAVCKRLQTLVEHDLVPAASEVTDAELQYLLQRTRQAPYAGTIDSLLAGILQDFAHDVGFEEMPSVGTKPLLKQVHQECYETVCGVPAFERRLRDLEAAYPDGEYDESVAEMLETAVTLCRDQRLSTAQFQSELEQTREATYPDGKPERFDDLVQSVVRFIGDGDGTIEDQIWDAVDESERERLLEADRELYDAWSDRIDDFCTVFSAYRTAYREQIRDFGVVSHTDVAYLVDAYFDESNHSQLSEALRAIDTAQRDRIQRTYRSRIRSLIIDEAQDVSAIQHAALSHIVTNDSRVFACGDVHQGIYLWRHADPTWFHTATAGGRYLGVDWETHENHTATTTYRCVPDIAAGINVIAEPMLTDPARGDIGDLDLTYPQLEAARHSNEDPAVHVSSFAGVGRPGSKTWATPDTEIGEANILATHIAKGLADGTFCDEGGDPLDITVLFRRGTRLPQYEAAFAAEGLNVHTATEGLFECPAVKMLLDVCEWIKSPASPERTKTLLTDSELGVDVDTSVFETHEWNLDTVLDTIENDIPPTQRQLLLGLRRLRDRRNVFYRQPASAYVEEVIESLALRSDATGYVSGVGPAQRVANLDALVETLSEWEGDTQYSPAEIIDLIEPFRQNPTEGPTQPSTAGEAYDVTFQTIHRSKGDQDDVVGIADPGFDVWSHGPHTQRFVTQGSIVGLAPPTDTTIPEDVTLPPFDGGLYEPPGGWNRDTGLRWAAARWSDTVCESAGREELVGPDRLSAVAANERAEAWRLLYVAMTRARDHLIVPLPHTDIENNHLRDRWLDTIRDGLEFQARGTDSYTLELYDSDPNTKAIDVGVNDVNLFAQRDSPTVSTSIDAVSETPPRRDDLERWLPRFLNPSTMYPLTEDPSEHAIAHLLGEPLHTDAHDVADDLPLSFEQVGPDGVGRCLHAVLTELVARGIPEQSLRTLSPEVRSVFDDVVTDTVSDVDPDESDGMYAFFERVLTGFLNTELWDRIEDPRTTVSVEQPIDGLVKLHGVEFEIHGQTDFVIEHPDGERTLTDVKIALAEPTGETRRRYELQIAAYAYLYEQTKGTDAPVQGTIETLGVTAETTTSSWPSDIVQSRLQRLLTSSRA